MQGGPVHQFLDVTVERAAREELRVETGDAVDDVDRPVRPVSIGKTVSPIRSTTPAAISDRFIATLSRDAGAGRIAAAGGRRGQRRRRPLRRRAGRMGRRGYRTALSSGGGASSWARCRRRRCCRPRTSKRADRCRRRGWSADVRCTGRRGARGTPSPAYPGAIPVTRVGPVPVQTGNTSKEWDAVVGSSPGAAVDPALILTPRPRSPHPRAVRRAAPRAGAGSSAFAVPSRWRRRLHFGAAFATERPAAGG